MQVNTTAVRTNLQCSNPISSTLDKTNPNNFTLTATSKEGCALGPIFFNPADANQRYNVTNVPNCAALPETDPEFQPLFFWFWQSAALATGGGANAVGVFCVPSLQLFDVVANASLESGFLTDVAPVDDYPAANNVTGGWLQGRAFNGCVTPRAPVHPLGSRCVAFQADLQRIGGHQHTVAFAGDPHGHPERDIPKRGAGPTRAAGRV
jgi:hypothetical protein